MKKFTTIVLILFTLGFVAACDSKTESAATGEPVPLEESTEEAQPEEQAKAEQAPRPESAKALEERYTNEAKEQINAENMESILADLEKEIEAEMAELEN